MAEKIAIELLHEGLNLCVRARQLDEGLIEQTKREMFPESAKEYPEHYNQCITPHLWVQDQYDKDLAAWENKTRQFLEST